MRVLHVGDDYAALRPCGLTFYSSAIMRAQAELGHEVSYLFSGRYYPRLAGPRFKRWRDGPVHMYELVNSVNHAHWEAGSRRPDLDADEPFGEAALDAALDAARPELVHVQELARLPSSLLAKVHARGIPLVMTLHDYRPVCASTRLLDADGQRCMRLEVGEDCARNCAGAPPGPEHLIDWTLRYERRRLKRAVPLADRFDFSAVGGMVGALTHRATNGGPAPASEPAGPPPAGAPPAAYQRRRDVNVQRLGLCDRLVAPSRRVAEIYAELGVDPSRMVVQRLSLPHLERLAPSRRTEVGMPLRFLTLGAGAHPAKGSRAILEAVEVLEAAGRGGDYFLEVLGHVEPMVHEALAGVPSVALRGPYVPGELGQLLEAADVGIVPSTWEETHGFVGIEMLAKGLPLIGSALGGIQEYVREGETGWLNASASGAELASIMTALMDDPASVQRLRRSVRELRHELVRPFGAHVRELEALYAEVIADHAAAMR